MPLKYKYIFKYFIYFYIDRLPLPHKMQHELHWRGRGRGKNWATILSWMSSWNVMVQILPWNFEGSIKYDMGDIWRGSCPPLNSKATAIAVAGGAVFNLYTWCLFPWSKLRIPAKGGEKKQVLAHFFSPTGLMAAQGEEGGIQREDMGENGETAA